MKPTPKLNIAVFALELFLAIFAITFILKQEFIWASIFTLLFFLAFVFLEQWEVL